MDFKSAFSNLTTRKPENRYFYTDPEIQEQEKIVANLQASGMSPEVIQVQEQQLEKMKGRRQQPRAIEESMPSMSSDQVERDALKKQTVERQKFGAPQVLSALSDMASASGRTFGTEPTKNLEKTQERIVSEGKKAQEDLEIKFVNDPNSAASRMAQQAAARLLNKSPQEMAGMSLMQIEKSFPLWKEALNNEESRELKKMDREMRTQSAKEASDFKKMQFEALEENRRQLAEDRKAKRDLQEQQQIDTKVQRHSAALQKENLPEIVNTYNELRDVFEGEKDVKGVGILESHIPGLFLGSEGVRNRTNLQQLANSLLKQRSGAAVSDQEYRRFLLELQAGNMPTERAIRAHLGKMGSDARAIIGQLEAGLPPSALEEYSSHPGAVRSSDVRDPSTLDKRGSIKEVKRKTKDGRTAIFDSNTKQFLRYE